MISLPTNQAGGSVMGIIITIIVLYLFIGCVVEGTRAKYENKKFRIGLDVLKWPYFLIKG